MAIQTAVYLRKKFVLLTLIISILFLQACSNSKQEYEEPTGKTGGEFNNSVSFREKDNNDIVIAIVPKSLDNPIFLDTKEAAERKCMELGVKFEWLAPYQIDEREQKLIVESLIRRQVDGIAISCVNPVGIKDAIDRAIQSGIKVATFDSDSPDSKRIFYCGTNNYKAGAECAKALKKVLKLKDKGKKLLQVFVMTGNPDSHNLRERLRGFKETCQKEELKIQINDVLYCNDDIIRAGELMEQYIQANPSVDVFLSTGGWPLIAPSDSMPIFHKWCSNGGISIVVDTSYPILVAAKKGMADALVGQDFSKMGELSVLYLYKAIKGEEIKQKFIDTGLELGDRTNYELLLKTKRPWEIK